MRRQLNTEFYDVHRVDVNTIRNAVVRAKGVIRQKHVTEDRLRNARDYLTLYDSYRDNPNEKDLQLLLSSIPELGFKS